ncbi:hypothetical protein Bca101_038568 [Brassica carinata]
MACVLELWSFLHLVPLQYAELKPVPCLSYADAVKLRESSASPILTQVLTDGCYFLVLVYEAKALKLSDFEQRQLDTNMKFICKIVDVCHQEMFLMDRISDLPDTLLLRVLSLLPSAKDVVATMVLSKRWEFLWLSVPRLVFDDQDIEYGNLKVEKCRDDNVTLFTVRVPSLKRLVLHTSENRDRDDSDGFVINAPCLEYFNIIDHKGGFCVIENDMPNVVEAYVDVTHSHPRMILGSITSVKRLYLCLSNSKDLYPDDTLFHRLVHLTLCTCETEWLNLLVSMLRDSPSLRALKLEQYHGLPAHHLRASWNEPSSVPVCLLSSLETLEWVNYEGTEEEKEVVGFMFRNGSCLKKVAISSKSNDCNKKLEMIKELTWSIRRSPTCQLAFD